MPLTDTDIVSLKQHIYDNFLGLFHQSAGATAADTKTFLTFEPVGTPLSSGMFKLHAADATFYGPLATEVFSTLANVVPALNADVFLPTDRGLEPIYEMLLLGAQCPADSPVNTLFDAVKSEAVQGFAEAKTPSLRGGWYRPAFALPPDWYDPGVDANWTAFTATSGTSTPPPPRGDVPIPRGPAWGWHVLAEADRPLLQNPEILQSLSTADLQMTVSDAVTPAAASDTVLTGPTRLSALGAVTRRADLLVTSFTPATAVASEAPVALASEAPVALESAQSTVDFAVDRPMLAISAEAMSLSSDTRPSLASFVQTFNPAVDHLDLSAAPIRVPVDTTGASALVMVTPETTLAVNQPALIGAALSGIIATTQPQPVASQSLAISMSYCLVTAHRPWMSQALFSTPGWSLPGFTAAGFSGDGSSAAVLPAVPIACLVIRDLSITADWSEISGVAQQSAAFGPFSLVGQTVDKAKSSLSVHGMQVLGWVCQVMPALPPMDAVLPQQ